ncbi:nose resistant to fluoxetine protein 6-like [Diachasmimorpha longicaudata]|uniref:nose resistant to fluoxetine protein 6-like n=1 Tax=Diachasmimorpha longicaudata TaxID=58733 RepID=UPI0030B8FD35
MRDDQLIAISILITSLSYLIILNRYDQSLRSELTLFREKMGSITVTSVSLFILQIFIASINCQVPPNDFFANIAERLLEQFQVNSQSGVSPRIFDVISELQPVNIIELGTQGSWQSVVNRDSASNRKCDRQFSLFRSGLQKLELWALKMIDSSSKIPTGILEGNLKDLGVYDECIATKVEKGSESIRGRHCMYSFSVNELKTNISLSLTSSICIPDGCGAADLARMINQSIDLASNYPDIDLKVNSVTCSAVEAEPWDKGGIIALSVLSFYFALLICCTICDLLLTKSSNSVTRSITAKLSKFSLISNARRILSTRIPPGNIPALQGIRFFSMGWVVLGHVYYIHSFGVISNQLAVAEWLKSWESLYIIIAPFTVDTFFVISGFLISYLFLKHMAKGGKFNPIMYYVHRYLRLTPAYGALLLLTIFIFPRIGSGAVWEANMSLQTESCSKNWWANLLYLQNYVNSQYLLCLGHAWYLAVDMQLFWISPLIIYPLAKKPRLGLAVLSAFIIASIIIPASISAKEEYSGGLFLGTNKTHQSNQMRYYYVATHTRAGPWLMGVLMGYKLAVMKNQRLNKKIVTLGWISAICAFAFGFFSYRIFQEDGYQYTLYWEIFYAGFARHIWAYGVCWLIFASILGYGGIIAKFLSLPVFMPLGRISYCIYLVHFITQYMRISAVRIPVYFSNLTMLYLFLSDFVLCIVGGFILSLLFESPFMALEKMLLGRKRRNQVKTDRGDNTGTGGVHNNGYQHDNGHVDVEKK